MSDRLIGSKRSVRSGVALRDEGPNVQLSRSAGTQTAASADPPSEKRRRLSPLPSKPRAPVPRMTDIEELAYRKLLATIPYTDPFHALFRSTFPNLKLLEGSFPIETEVHCHLPYGLQHVEGRGEVEFQLGGLLVFSSDFEVYETITSAHKSCQLDSTVENQLSDFFIRKYSRSDPPEMSYGWTQSAGDKLGLGDDEMRHKHPFEKEEELTEAVWGKVFSDRAGDDVPVVKIWVAFASLFQSLAERDNAKEWNRGDGDCVVM